MALQSVSDSNFDSEVLQSDMPILVDFWATWCQPCQRLNPVLEEISSDYVNKLKILKMNVEENTAIPSKYSVLGIPTLIIFKGGKVAASKAGYMTKTQLAAFIDGSL